jgi:hypothetical protein
MKLVSYGATWPREIRIAPHFRLIHLYHGQLTL